MKTALAVGALLLLTAPVSPAFAHDDDDSYGSYSQHSQLHSELGEAHERAHEEGFSSWREHRAYHRALKDLHREYHQENSGDYPWWSRRYW